MWFWNFIFRDNARAEENKIQVFETVIRELSEEIENLKKQIKEMQNEMEKLYCSSINYSYMTAMLG
jgi:predicted RNase H-like nuclease (RuvC/YqgF family)